MGLPGFFFTFFPGAFAMRSLILVILVVGVLYLASHRGAVNTSNQPPGSGALPPPPPPPPPGSSTQQGNQDTFNQVMTAINGVIAGVDSYLASRPASTSTGSGQQPIGSVYDF